MTSSQRRSFYNFVQAATHRYGPNGTFWQDKPDVPASARAKYWQIWNEPNLGIYWNRRPSARQYALMLIGASDAAKRGDGAAQPIAAGLPWSGGSNINPPDFLRAMFLYRPELREKIAAIAIHPYDPSPDGVLDGVTLTRRALKGTSGLFKAMWLTEFGWATGRADGRFQVNEFTQGRNLELTYNKLIAARTQYRIKGAIWFNLWDLRNGDWWAERTGLWRVNNTPKPSWYRLNCVTGTSLCRR